MFSHRPRLTLRRSATGEQYKQSLITQKLDALKKFSKGDAVTDGRVNGTYIEGDPITGEATVRFGVAKKKMSPLALTPLPKRAI